MNNHRNNSLTRATQTDWMIDIVPPPPKLIVPSFIRLFVIRRILDNFIDEKDEKEDVERKINAMVEPLTDDKVHQVSYNVLHRLWNNGLKIYMNTWYKEQEQAVIIEMIFNDIILVQFAEEYQEITTYNNDNDGDLSCNYNQCLVFNTNDLMYSIFQYLNFWGELYNCTFVNSHWLCLVWNSTSLSCVDLTSLIKRMQRYKQGDENMCTRMWQRVANAKKIQFDLKSYSYCSDLLLNRLSMLVNVDSINVKLGVDDISILKALMQKFQNKIRIFVLDLVPDYVAVHGYGRNTNDVNINSTDNILSPLKLLNANLININSLHFYIIWSIMCQTLIIRANNISKSWCEHVISKCDCSGIKSLTLDKFKFVNSSTMQDRSTRLILFKLAQKFENVENLKLCVHVIDVYADPALEYFLVSLCRIQSKKNVNIELRVIVDTDHLERLQIQQFCSTNNVKIEKLSIDFDDNQSDCTKLFKTIATEMKDLKWIALENGVRLLQDLDTFKFGVDEKKTKSECDGNGEYFPSLEVIEIDTGMYPPPIDNINTFFESSKFFSQLESVRNDLLIICRVDCREWERNLPSLYKTFDILHSLVIKKCMLIDIRIRFGCYTSSTILEPLKNKYCSYFNKKRTEKEYKQPVLSQKQKKYCRSMTSPIVRFGRTAPYDYVRVANTSVRSLQRQE